MLFKQSSWTKCIALLLIQIYFVQTSVANTAFNTSDSSVGKPRVQSIDNSADQSLHQPVVYCVGDIHSSITAQEQIFNKLTLLARETEIGFFGIEGAWETFQFDAFHAIPDENLQKNLLQKYLKMGVISGVEYFCCQNNIPVYGLEDPGIYQSNRQQYSELYNSLPERQSYMELLKDIRQACASNCFSTEGFLITNLFSMLYAGTLDLYEFTAHLKTLLERHEVVLNPKASPALYFLCYNNSDEFPWEIEQLIDEINAIDRAVKDEFITYHRDKMLVDVARRIDILDRIFSMEASSDLVQTVRDNYRLFQFDNLRDSLKLIWGNTPELQNKLEQISQLGTNHDEYLDSCLAFYETARYREYIIARKTEQKLKELNAKRCVIFTGGFHQRGIENYFEKKNITCVPIIPDAIESSDEDVSTSYSTTLINSDSLFKSLQRSMIAVEALFQSQNKTAEVVTDGVIHKIIDLMETRKLSKRALRREALAFVEQWKGNYRPSVSYNDEMYQSIRNAVASMDETDGAVIIPVPNRDGYSLVLSRKPLTKNSFPPQKGITQFLSLDSVEGYHRYLVRTEDQVNSKGTRSSSDGRIIWGSTLLGTLMLTAAGVLPVLAELQANPTALASVKLFLSTLFTAEITMFMVFRSIVSSVLAVKTIFTRSKPIQFTIPDHYYPEVTIQFPVRNELFDAVKATVDQALVQDYPKDKLKMQIIDNSELGDPKNKAEFDKIAKYAMDNGIQLIHRDGTKGAKVGNLNLGFRGDPQRGIEPATGELLCCVDAETKFPPDALKRLVPMYVLNPKNAGSFRLGYRYGYAKDGKPTFAERGSIFSFNFLGQSEKVSDNYSFTPTPGDCLMVSREVLEEMDGWIPEQIESKVDKAEDHALSYELLLRGRNVTLVNTGEAMVGSGHPQSYAGRLIQLTRYAYGGIQLLKTFFGRIVVSKRMSSSDKAYAITRLLGDMPLLLVSVSLLVTVFTGTKLVTYLALPLFGSVNWYFIISFILPMYLMSREFSALFGNGEQATKGIAAFGQSIAEFFKNLLSFFMQGVGAYVEVAHAQIAALLGFKKPFVSPPRVGEERMPFLEVVGKSKKTFFTMAGIAAIAALFKNLGDFVSVFQYVGVSGAMSYLSGPSAFIPDAIITNADKVENPYLSSGMFFIALLIAIPFIMDWDPAKDVRRVRDAFSLLKNKIGSSIKNIIKMQAMAWFKDNVSPAVMDEELVDAANLLDTLEPEDRIRLELYSFKEDIELKQILRFATYKKMLLALLTKHDVWLTRQVDAIRSDPAMAAKFNELSSVYASFYPQMPQTHKSVLAMFFADYMASRLFFSPVDTYMETPVCSDLIGFLADSIPQTLLPLCYGGLKYGINLSERQQFYLAKIYNFAEPLANSVPYGLFDVIPEFEQLTTPPADIWTDMRVLDLLETSL